jgi:hypothetical protein
MARAFFSYSRGQREVCWTLEEMDEEEQENKQTKNRQKEQSNVLSHWQRDSDETPAAG